ncbi:MAG: VCBS repeat-containing protein [Deltaproteobacteria bacterium]|nr:VCBS repeat-containing protein [Deltaproteobacteria bacterium]
MRATISIALATLALAGCTELLDEAGRPCPCGPGWSCCANVNLCVPGGSACPGEASTSTGSSSGSTGAGCTQGSTGSGSTTGSSTTTSGTTFGSSGTTGVMRILEPAVSYPLAGQPIGVALGDENGDGRADVIVAETSMLTVLAAQADGGLASSAGTTPLASAPTAVVALDLDGDPNEDLVVAQTDEGGPALAVWRGRGDGTFTAGDRYGLPQKATLLAAGSIWPAGGPVVVAVDGQGTASIFLGDGLGHLGTPTTLTVPASPVALVLDHFLAPNRLDAVIASSTQVTLVPNLAAPGTPVTFAYGPQRALASGDVDGDGRVDFMTLSLTNNDVVAYLNAGDGGFVPQSPTQLAGVGPTWAAFANISGAPAVVALNAQSNDVTVERDFGGTFVFGGIYPMSGPPLGLAVGDLNGDQSADVVVLGGACGTGSVQVLLSN